MDKDILQPFFDEPSREFSLFVVAQRVNVPAHALIEELDAYTIKGVLKSRVDKVYKFYRANTASHLFRLLKVSALAQAVIESGLVEALEEGCDARAVFLVGKSAAGEDKKADAIQMMVIGKEKELDISKYEHILERAIKVNICSDTANNEKALMNGLKLSGAI